MSGSLLDFLPNLSLHFYTLGFTLFLIGAGAGASIIVWIGLAGMAVAALLIWAALAQSWLDEFFAKLRPIYFFDIIVDLK